MLDYFTANTVSETVCFIMALVCLYKDESNIWRSMILFLLLSCMADYLGIYLHLHKHNNLWVYNLFMIFEAGFTNLMLWFLLNKYNSGKVIIAGLALFVILYVAEIIQHGILEYNNLAYTVLSIIFVLNCLHYYYHLMIDEHYIIPSRSPAFWWIAGTLVFYFSNMVLNIFYDRLNALMILPHHHLSYFIIKTLNIILYSCWSFSFICRRWLTTTSGN